MNRLSLLSRTIFACCICLPATPNYAGMSSVQTAGLFEGRFEMPRAIQDVTDPHKLQRFLDDPNTLNRMSAVRRLGEIEGPKAVGELAKRFEKEPYLVNRPPRTFVKQEIIRVLGRVGGQAAEATLLNIAQTYLNRGPQCTCRECKERGYPIGVHDGDYSSTLQGVFGVLQKWTHDPKVLDVATRGISQEHLGESDIMGIAAWELYLAATMAKEGMVTEEQEADYLVDFMVKNSLPVKTHLDEAYGGRTLESMQTEAIGNLFGQYSQDALAHLEAQTKLAPPNTPRHMPLIFGRNHVRDGIKARSVEKPSLPQPR